MGKGARKRKSLVNITMEAALQTANTSLVQPGDLPKARSQSHTRALPLQLAQELGQPPQRDSAAPQGALTAHCALKTK